MVAKIFLDAFALRFPRTGVVNYTYNVIKTLHENPDCDTTILLHDMGFFDPKLGDFAKSIPYRLPGETDFERRQRSLLGELWQVPGLPLPLPGMTTRVTDPCDVYHCTDIYYYPSAKAHKNIITMYDLTTTLYPEAHEPLNIQKEKEKIASLKEFDAIISISNATKDDLVKYCGIDDNKIITSYLGVDSIYEHPEFIERQELTDRLGIPKGRRYLLSVSTIEPRKNIIGTLEAFRLFAERNTEDDDVVLVLAGHHGWNNERLSKYLSTYPYRNRIFSTGYAPIELMPSLYRYAESFIYLSFYEGFGLPILEAMKSSAPVICSNTSSMPEVIGDCGTLVSPDFPNEACEAIEQLLRKPALAQSYRDRALKRSQAFTWKAHVEQLLGVYGVKQSSLTAQSESAPIALSCPPAGQKDPGEDRVRYGAFLEAQRRTDAEQRRERREHIKLMTVRPRFIVLIEGNDDKAAIDATIASCTNQIYPPAQVVLQRGDIADEPKGSAFFIWLNEGDLLHERALYECAARINADPSVEMVYFDEDSFDADGERHTPFFKPDWSPDYLEAVNYVGPSACYAFPLAGTILNGSAGQYDFTLRFTEQARSIAHIRQILLHRPTSPAAPQDEAVLKRERQALSGRLNRTQRKGVVEQIRPRLGAYRIKPHLDRTPLVSIVIPTAAKKVTINGEKRDLIAACVKSIIERSTYRNIEFVIVENGDLSHDRLRHVGDIPLRYVTYRDRQVNISRKMNLGAACAAGEFLLLLNDDTEVISPDWIERLLFHFEKPHVGMVGGKLLYPDLTVQHAGVIVTHGHPDHVSRGSEREAAGYFFSGCAVRNYLAMTGAMTLIRSKLFQELGGYEERMPLTFNDIDLSLRVWRTGLTVLIDPDVELFHFEGKSASNSYNFDDRDFFFDRWGHVSNDPFYNEDYFSLTPPDYEFCENVRFI